MNRINYTFKLIIIGDSVVGKSSLMRKFTQNEYEDGILNTIGMDFSIKIIKRNDDIVKLQIWDTAGQERFKNILSSYYRGADAILICYDVTNKKSFESLKYWVQTVNNLCKETAEIIIIGTKLDLEEQRTISYNDASQLCKDFGYDYVEISAKNDDSNKIREVIFNPLLDKLIKTKDKERNDDFKNFVVLHKSEVIKDNSCCLN